MPTSLITIAIIVQCLTSTHADCVLREQNENMRNLKADILITSLTKLDWSCSNSGQKDANFRRLFKQASPGFNEILMSSTYEMPLDCSIVLATAVIVFVVGADMRRNV
uniref:Uncharacterized protein n=1 Tax=Glossina austeni TaxID=7395 RepID=A0A1A9V7W7_GLOAU